MVESGDIVRGEYASSPSRFFAARLPLSLAILIGALTWLPASGRCAPALEAFPAAEEGRKREVIELPPLADESLVKVELLIGKTVEIDAVNRYFFSGELETETIPGWGFERYILREPGLMAGTLMAVDPDAPRVERFITLGGETSLLRYNSRVPIVVYLPADFELRHRLWRAESEPAGSARFLQKLVLPGNRVAVVAEGDLEARSIGSYGVRLYSTRHSPEPDDTTFFVAGVTRERDGFIERVSLAELGADEPPSLVVVIRSVGTGGYLSADAYRLAEDGIVLRGSVSGLPADADPVPRLAETIQAMEQ